MTETRAMPSPHVHNDGRVTLSLFAPDAKQVLVDSDFRLGQEVVAQPWDRVDGANRALAGLSMGCMQAWNLLCTHPDQFTAAGLFSGTAELDKLDASGAVPALRGYKTVFVSVGDWDAPRLRDSMLAAPAGLAERGIPTGLFTMPGGHVWSVWQRSLLEFAGALQQAGWPG